MSKDQTTAPAMRPDPVTAARIARNIAEIERDYGMAYGPLAEDLSREIIKTMAKAIADPWQFFEGDYTATLMLAGWRTTRGVPSQEIWLEFGEIVPADEEASYTWVGAAAGVGPARLGLEFKVRRGLHDLAVKAIGNITVVKPLLDAGFIRDGSNERMFIPIDIPAEAIALGWEQSDLVKAVTPAGRAVQAAMAAEAALDALVEHLRGEAKRK